jgi:hypothetical protein
VVALPSQHHRHAVKIALIAKIVSGKTDIPEINAFFMSDSIEWLMHVIECLETNK